MISSWLWYEFPRWLLMVSLFHEPPYVYVTLWFGWILAQILGSFCFLIIVLLEFLYTVCITFYQMHSLDALWVSLPSWLLPLLCMFVSDSSLSPWFCFCLLWHWSHIPDTISQTTVKRLSPYFLLVPFSLRSGVLVGSCFCRRCKMSVHLHAGCG